MGGKLFVTILGLLLAQALAAILMGMVTNNVLTQAIVAVIFALAAISFMGRRRRAALPALLAFALGFLNIVYLSFLTASMWLVVMLCLDAAGFILSIDLLDQPTRKGRTRKSVHRRKILDKELPKREQPKVVVYQAAPLRPKRTTRKTAKKSAKKKTAKKTAKRTTKKAVKKTLQQPKRTIRRRATKKR